MFKLKKILSAITVIVFSINGVIGQFYNIDDYDGDTVTTCSGFFFDSGGNFGDYGNNEHYTITFCSSGGENLRFEFTDFNTNWNFGPQTDYMLIYDGPTTSSPPIGGMFYYNLGTPFIINSSGQYLTFEFISDGSTTHDGWRANISCFTITPDVQYHFNGTAMDDGNDCYTLTQEMTYTNGTIWYSEQLDLSQPFDIEFNMNFGSDDAGADGMAFVMQQIGVNALGNTGMGMGYGGNYFQPSLGIEFDVFENTQTNDPAEDHIAIQRDGNIDHANANNLAGPVQADASSANIETDTDYPVRITWDPSTNTIEVYFNCELRLSTQYDITNLIFSGNSMVYWGFTAGTGGAFNEQKVCLETNILTVPDDLYICQGESAQLDATGTVFSSYTWGPDYNLSSTTIQNPVASPDVTTTYYVTVTEPTCGFEKVDSVTVYVSAIDATVTGTDPACYGDNTGSADLTVTDGNAPFTYIWSEGSTTEDLNGISGGTYTVTVTDSSGCTVTATIDINEPDELLANITGTNIACYGDNNGIADLTVTGGTTNYSYSWNTGATTEDLNGLSGGIYNVTVSDANGCTAEASVNISEPDELVATITGTDLLCVGDNSGAADLSVSGGTVDYSYLWNTGATTEDLNDIAAGTYSVTVTDASSCTTITTINISEPADGMLITTSSTNSTCGMADGTASVSVTGGTSPYDYLWSGGETTNSISNLSAGSYSVTVTDDNGCTAIAVIDISDEGAPTATIIDSSDVTCYGYADGSATVDATGGTPPLSYIWSNGETTTTITGLSGGTYSVTVSDANNCNQVVSVTIDEPPALSINMSSTPETGGGGNGTATAGVSGGTPSYQYLWDGGQVTMTATGLTAGTYCVTVIDMNGCTISGCVDVTADLDSIYAGFTYNGNQCLTGNSFDFTNTGFSEAGATYFWDFQGGTPATSTDENPVNIIWTAPGTYTVTQTITHGVLTDNAIMDITVFNEPSVSVTGTDAGCFGLNNGSATASATAGTSPYNYLWSNGCTDATTSGLAAGDYSVTITDVNGCSATTSVTIGQPGEISVTIDAPNITCSGEGVTISASASNGTEPYTYAWSDGSSGSTITVSPLSETTYTVIVTDNYGCTTTSQITIDVYAPLSLNIYTNEAIICEGETATIYAIATGGTGNYSYFLDGIDATFPVLVYPVAVPPDNSQTYAITLNDDCGSVTEYLDIEVYNNPPVSFLSNTVEGCAPLTVHFNTGSGGAGYSYQWNFGDGSSGTVSYEQYPVHEFDLPGTYDVTLTITTPQGCTGSQTYNNMISVYSSPTASFLSIPQVASILEPYIYFENTSSTTYYSEWDFGDGDMSGNTNPKHKYDHTGEYLVQLVIETEHGCSDSATTVIVIMDEYTFYAPNAFSPDQDEMNALFSPIGYGIDPDYWHLIIYDRWGEKVWETHIFDIDKESGKVLHGWDGRIHDDKMGENGVYTWLVIYRDLSGAEHRRAGLVRLIR